MDVSKNIYRLRLLRGYSQDDIAKKLNISRQTYLKFENNQASMSLDQLEKLANIYGINIQELISKPEDIEKFKEMYLYTLSKFKTAGVPKTKLAKLLYLEDFRHFYENLESMSGTFYKCATHGPLADSFLQIHDEMCESGKVSVDYLSGGAQMVKIQTNKTDFPLLNEEEKREIDEICELWRDIKTEVIVNYTHEQKPWMACRKNEIIPYSLILQEDPDHVYTPVK